MRYLDILRKKNKQDDSNPDLYRLIHSTNPNPSQIPWTKRRYELNEKDELSGVQANSSGNEINELNERSAGDLVEGCQVEWMSEVLGVCSGQVVFLLEEGWLIVQVHNPQATMVLLHISRVI